MTHIPQSFTEIITGRFYLYTDLRWVTDSDDNYGLSYYQFNHSASLGIDPVYEWEQRGFAVRENTTLSEIMVTGRTTNAEPIDLELIFLERKPDSPARWETGYNSDAEMTNTIIYRDNFFTPSVGNAFSGAINHMHRRKISLNHIFSEDSYLSMYLKPIGVLTVNSFFLCDVSYTFINN